MKKRLLVIALIVMAISGFTLAQDSSTTGYELDQTVVVSTLDFTFAYPNGWVHDIGQRVSVAENEDDLAAMIDDDTATQPSGYTLTFSSAPKSVFTDALSNDDPTLDEVVAVATSSVEVDVQFDLPIMARRAVSFTGVNASGRWGVGSVWEMDGTYLILGMGTPEAEITDAFMELYVAVAATMKQFADDPIELGEEPVVVGDLSVPYPLDWTVEELTVDPFTGVGFFADAADIAVWNADGTTGAAAFQVLTASTTELADLSAREAAENVTGILEDTSIEGEFLIGDTVGFGVSGMDVNGYVYVVSMTPTDDSWMFYSLTAGDRETGEAAIPVFMAMLQQISAAE